MVIEKPLCYSEVSGVTICTKVYDTNLAADCEGEEHLEDGFIVAVAVSDGSNPFLAEKSAWPIHIVRQKTTTTLDFGTTDTPVHSLLPNHELVEISAQEAEIDGQCGIWMFAIIKEEAQMMAMATLIREYNRA